MKIQHATLIGALGLPLLSICCLQLFISLDFPNGINRHISGTFEMPPTALYFLLSLFHVPLGAALGFMTVCLSRKSVGNKSGKLKKLCIFGAGLLFAILLYFMLQIFGNPFNSSGSKHFDIITVTLWLGLPAIWSLALFVKGLISSYR